MAAGLSFYLNGSAELKNVYCQYYAKDGRLNMSVALKVDKDAFKDGKLTKEQSAHLTWLKGLVNRYEADMRLSGRPTEKADVESIILEATGKKRKVVKTESFSAYFSRYLEAVKAGEILNDGKEYSTSYKDTARAVLKILPRTELASVPVESIGVEEMRGFASALTTLKSRNKKCPRYSKNTIAVYCEFVRTFIDEGRKLGWHRGTKISMDGAKITRDKIDYAVYLDKDEMLKIAAIDYSGEESRWRDAFLLGCMLGMRYGDLHRLGPIHRNGDVVNIETGKTGKAVWVPLSPWAREIWDKYAGSFATPHRRDMLAFAKKLGKDAGIDSPVFFSRTEGGKKVEKWVPKYELMGTHTMRRSFATNAYKAGVPMPSIMKVTGHTTTANFLKYIRLTDEEHATLLLDHPHFK